MNKKSSDHKQRIQAVRVVHKELKSRAAGFYERSRQALDPFVSADAMAKLTAGGKAILAQAKPLTIGAHRLEASLAVGRHEH